MRALTLRKLLIIFAVIVFLSGTYSQFAQLIYTNHSSNAPDSFKINLIVTAVTTWIVTLPVIMLSLWAAHNLKAFSWLTDKRLITALSVSCVVVIASALANSISNIVALRALPNFPNLPEFNAMKIASELNWLFYSFLEVLIMLFAIRQLKHKISKTQITDDET
jgi:hypothetical protein